MENTDTVRLQLTVTTQLADTLTQVGVRLGLARIDVARLVLTQGLELLCQRLGFEVPKADDDTAQRAC